MNILFLFIVGFVLFGLFFFLQRIYAPKVFYGLIFATFFWLLFQGLFAQWGFFESFTAMPPRLLVILIPNMILLLTVAFFPANPKLKAIPAQQIVYFQSFRIVMEFILWNLVLQKRLPEILTFTGSNYDIVIGVTAPLVAALFLKKDEENLLIGQIWNVAGFLILTNTAVHGILSAPTPLQVFHTIPPNMLIAHFPWIWLPGFVVPMALLGHIVSFKQLSLMKKN